MSAIHQVLALLALLCLSEVQAAPPPARLTLAQREQMARRDRWLARAGTHYRAGEIDETITAIHKALALERAVFGEIQSASLPWLQFKARRHEEREQFTEAIAARQEVLRWLRSRYDRADWRITDARLDLEETRGLARLDAEQRRQLRQTEQWNARLFGLWQQGRSREALPLAQKALAVRRKVLGETHRLTALSWFNLGAQFHAVNRLRDAERCYRHNLEILERTLGKQHPEYADSLNNLGGLCRDRGDQPRARALLEQACAVIRRTQGENIAIYTRCLGNLAWVYRDLGDHVRALSLFEQARSILKVLVGSKHSDYARSLNNLAVLYHDLGDDKRAQSLLEQALAIRKKVLGEKHPEYGESLNNLAAFYQGKGDPARARPLHEQALALTRATVGKNLSTGEQARARPLFEQALDIEQRHLEATFSALSDRQRLALLARSRHSLNAYLSIPSRESAASEFARVLAWKAAVGARQAEDRLRRDHPALVSLLEQLRTARAGLAQLASRPPTPVGQDDWLKRFRALEEQKEKLEVRLARTNAAFRRLRQFDPESIAKALPEGVALIDLFLYRHTIADPDRKGG
jgi:Tfp pilus assembly protein PilF